MIKHIKCDIFESGADVICHQVNCQGVMGSGIAKQVRERYPWVYAEYKECCSLSPDYILLGGYQQVYIDEKRVVLNVFGQRYYGYDKKCYTNYDALKQAFEDISKTYHNKIIAIPYLMGCARGGGDWNIVYKIIEEVFADYNGEVLICEYDKG